MQPASSYKYSVALTLPFAEADRIVREALKGEGFGIISEIDIQAKLREKLGVDHPPHKILGACNPRLAYQALQDNRDVALVLPCNVVLEEQDGQATVSALLPSMVLKPFTGQQVQESARTAEAAMKRVFDALTSSPHS